MTEGLSYWTIFANASGIVEISNCSFFIYTKVNENCNTQTTQ